MTHKLVYLLMVLSLLVPLVSCKSEPTPRDAAEEPAEGSTKPPRHRVTVLASATGKVAGADVPAQSGGTIELQTKVAVTFPPESLRQDHSVLIQEMAEKPVADEGTLYLPGPAFEIDAEEEVFAKPVLITIHYDQSRLPAGITEQEVFAVFFYENEWHRAYGEVDTKANTITVETVHASIWTWAIDKLANAVGAIESLFGVSDPKKVPMTVQEAEELVEKRRQEFYDAVDVFELEQAEFEGDLSHAAEEGALELSLHHVADELLAGAAAKAGGAKLMALTLGKTVVGVLGLVTGSLHLFTESVQSGEMIAEMVKVEQAYDRLVDAEAKLWTLRHPLANTMPPELAEAMRRTAPEETVPQVGVPDLPALPTGASRIVFSSKPEDGSTRSPEIYVMNGDGSGRTRLTTNDDTDIEPALSPDGTRIAFVSDRDGNYEIYTMRVDGSDLRRLTHDNKVDPVTRDMSPAWSPDGTRIVFSSMRTGSYDLYVMNADGSGVTNLTNSPRASDVHPHWSPDGTRIVFTSTATRGESPDIYVINADGSNLTNLTGRPGSPDLSPEWSPDGTRIVFVPRLGDEFEIHTMASDGSDRRCVLNETDAVLDSLSKPTWSPDGTHIAFAGYKGEEQDIYVVDAEGMVMDNITENAVYDDEPSWGIAAGTLPPSDPASAAATATPAREEPEAPAPTATSLPEPEDTNSVVYRIGTNAEHPPFAFVDEAGDLAGFDIALLAAIAQSAGFRYELVSTKLWDTLFVALQAGEFDAVVSAATITREREEIVDFSEPYFAIHSVVVVRRADAGEIDVVQDLDGKKVGVGDRSSGKRWLTENTSADVVAYDSAEIAFVALLAGEVDALFLDEQIALARIEKMQESVVLAGEPVATEFYGIAVSQDRPELLDAINAGLSQIRENGRYDRIYADWFAAPKPAAIATPVSPSTSEKAKIAFLSMRDGDDLELYVMDADGSHVVRLTDNDIGEQYVSWSPDGTMLACYAHGGPHGRSGLWVIRADGGGLEDLDIVGATPSWSPDGKTIIYYNRDFALAVAHADGTGERLFSSLNLGPSFYPSWSPNGTKVAFLAERSSANKNAYVLDADGTHLVPLHVKESRDSRPIWSPDSTWVVFHSQIQRRWDIYVVKADGTEKRNLTEEHTGESSDPDWSPDGRHIAYVYKTDSAQAIYVMDAQGQNKREIISSADHSWTRVAVPLWSPDGQQLLFRALGDEDWDIWVVRVDGSGLTQLTDSPEYDGMAVWQPVSGVGTQPPAPKPEADDPIVGRWTWRNDFNGTWYIYTFAVDGSLRITTESDVNHLTEGTYRIVDRNTLGLTYNRSTEYLSSPGTESLWQYEITVRDVAYEGRTQRRTVLLLTDKRGGEQVFIRLD